METTTKLKCEGCLKEFDPLYPGQYLPPVLCPPCLRDNAGNMGGADY